MPQLLVASCLWALGWAALFYLLAATQPMWTRGWSPSPKSHENERFWLTRNVIGIMHALLISALGVPALFAFLGSPEYARYATSDHLAHCAVDPGNERLLPWDTFGRMTALGGLAFTAFTAVDLVIMFAHNLLTWDYFLHHIVFIIAGVLIRGHCMLPFNAAVLLSMEISTPFLNTVLLFRNRGEKYQTMNVVNGVTFFVTFIVFRLVLNGYGTMELWVAIARHAAVPNKVPTWQVYFLAIAISIGALIQIYWFPSIAKMFCGRLWKLVMGIEDIGETSSEEDAEKQPNNERTQLLARANA